MSKLPSLTIDDCLTIIFKPTSCCNLRCKYCFSHVNRDLQRKMTREEIYHAIRWSIDYVKYKGYKAVTWLWHGGEPMLIGAKLFAELTEYVISEFEKSNIRLLLSLQTNLTLFSPDWIDVFQKHYKDNIGVSLDFKTNARCDATGRFYDEKIISSIKELNKYHIGLSGVLGLVTPDNVKCVHEMYEFYKSNNLSFQISRYFPSTSPLECEKKYILSDAEYSNFIIKLFDIWYDDPDPKIEIFNLREMAVGLINGARNLCIAQKNGCTQRIICIEAGGEIYNCGRYDSAEYLLGTISNSVQDVATAVSQRKHCPLPAKCLKCKYFKLCNGGCRYERDINGGFINCAADRLILAHIEKRLIESGCELADLTKEDC